MPASEPAPTHRSSVKETVTQLVIAFVMAFVFRGFVIEAFLIPTGSMAPTLMGAHMRITSPVSGYTWSVGPWDMVPGSASGAAMPIQGSASPIRVPDPMTREDYVRGNIPLLGGDRIFVLKYLPALFDPSRFDCVVFKNPTNPDENYIKRLIGLPNEQVALIHGDVFVRPATGDQPRPEHWLAPGWRIARKPVRVQQALWMPVFSSEYAPISPTSPPEWSPPWIGSSGFEVGRAPVYRYDGSGASTLRWNDAAFPIDDYYPYNHSRISGAAPHGYPHPRFHVSDVRLRAGIQPNGTGGTFTAVVVASGHEFRAEIDGTTVRLSRRTVPMRGDLIPAEPGPWTDMGGGTLSRPLQQGRVTDVEFWHADQALHLFIGGSRVAYAEYDWSPGDRILHATGRTLDELLESQDRAIDRLPEGVRRGVGLDPKREDHLRAANILAVPGEYRPTTARWEFSGPVTLHRVGLDRDIYYQPGIYTSGGDPTSPHSLFGEPALSTHPDQPALLGAHQFFACGDNSAASLDGRLWDAPDPWIASTIDPAMGIVPRDLLIGKAFFVYFPAMHRDRPVPVIDFGRMRYIW